MHWVRRWIIRFKIRIHIEQLAERQLSTNTLKINLRWISRADLQIRDVEIAIIAVAMLRNEVGQLPLSG